jgi:hypothetical protein
MTHIPIQLPFKGFTEQSQYSVVPPGMTPSCLNVMPSDVWNGRTRIGVRNGTKTVTQTDVQFLGSYRVYESGVLTEKLIMVSGGKVYYANPRAATNPATFVWTLFGSGTGSGQTQYVEFLNTTGFVEGVQFNDHFYFVDGDHYVLVHLGTPTSATAVTVWGDDSPKHGPFRTDPGTVTAGCRAKLICRWGARLVLAGYRDTPNLWFACSPDDTWPVAGGSHPTFVDGWSGSNPIGAITGTSANEYGTLGDPIVAIFPFAQSGLMFACSNSFSFLTNDPVFEEQVAMVSLTKSIGITGPRAFCQSQEKGAFILASDGLYFINANDFNFNRASRVSAGRLDSFFLRLDFGTPAIGAGPLAGGTQKPVVNPLATSTGAVTKYINETAGTVEFPSDTQTVAVDSGGTPSFTGSSVGTGDVLPFLCYDPDREGVWVFLAVNGVEGSSVHIYYDLKTDSFWPQKFADPLMYGPTSGVYIGTSRSDSGKLFMGGSESVAVLDRAYPIGVDGYYEEMTEQQQRSQLVLSSLTCGPIIATLPYRAMLSEVRVDLAEERYELPDGVTDYGTAPMIVATTGDTAQTALGLQTDSLFIGNLNPLIIDCGSASATGAAPTYDGGPAVNAQTNLIDGRYAIRPFGQYTSADPFAQGTARIYQGPGSWILRWDTGPNPDTWAVEQFVGASWVPEYKQIAPDLGSPNGMYVTAIQNPISPDVVDNASVSGAVFSEAEVTQIGSLVPGRNDAKRCRIRSEAIYLTISSDGKPWSIERMSAIVAQTGKSRGGVDVVA